MLHMYTILMMATANEDFNIYLCNYHVELQGLAYTSTGGKKHQPS